MWLKRAGDNADGHARDGTSFPWRRLVDGQPRRPRRPGFGQATRYHQRSELHMLRINVIAANENVNPASRGSRDRFLGSCGCPSWPTSGIQQTDDTHYNDNYQKVHLPPSLSCRGSSLKPLALLGVASPPWASFQRPVSGDTPFGVQ